MSEEDANAQQPLYGAVLCSTSLAQDVKAEVGTIGTELGAIHKLDLTSDVTHLLVGSVDSEKYRHVAKRRPDIHVLQPEWLFAVRDAWIQGDEFDLDALTEQYRLPTFYSLKICVTGFVDTRHRQQLESDITQNGAQYHGDLTKAVTHLIAAKPTGAKYDRARQWGITLVSLRWLEDSLERGMILDESCYDPLIDPEKQGHGAKQTSTRTLKKPIIGKRLRGEDSHNASGGKRKLRRTASARLNSQSQTLWQDMAVADGDSSHLEDSWTQSVDPGIVRPEPTVDTQPVPTEKTDSITKHSHSPKALFSDSICHLHGHNQKLAARLKQLLLENGAVIAEDSQQLDKSDRTLKVTILPSEWIAKPDCSLPSLSQHIMMATEWWVERCIKHKKILDPAKDVFSRSLHALPKDCFNGRVISTSGLGDDVRYVSRIIQAAGGTYEENVSRKLNLLIFKYAKDLEKPVYCAERNIDVVTPEWLVTSLKEFHQQAVYPYMLPRHVCDAIQKIIKDRRKQESEMSGSKQHTPQPGNTTKQAAQRLSGVGRKRPTPALALAKSATVADRPPPQPLRKPEPFEHVPSNSQDPPARSPRSPSRATSVHTEASQDKENMTNGPSKSDTPLVAAVPPPTASTTTITHPLPSEISAQTSALLSGLIARRQASSTSCSPALPPAPSLSSRRKLGRASSGSLLASVGPASPYVEDSDGGMSAVEELVPSQQVLYDVPGAEEHRAFMAKHLGKAAVEGGGRGRVKGLANVRDIASAAEKGIGSRVRGRHREAGFK